MKMSLSKSRYVENYFHNLRFSEKVIILARLIPRGKITTYGDLSKAAGGGVMAAQSITSILGKADQAGVKNIPFHRIVYADGKIWLDEQHKEERLRLYQAENLKINKNFKIVDFSKKRFDFKTVSWDKIKEMINETNQ